MGRDRDSSWHLNSQGWCLLRSYHSQSTGHDITNIQRQFFNDVTTLAASLRTRLAVLTSGTEVNISASGKACCWRGDNAAEIFMRKALRLLNLQKDISDYELLIDNYDSSDRRRSLFDLIYPRKSSDRTHISFLMQINSNPILIEHIPFIYNTLYLVHKRKKWNLIRASYVRK